MRGSNGYEVSLLAALEGEGSPIGVLVEHRDRGTVEYMARGYATAHRIKVSFGLLGEVDLAFRPSGRVLRSPESLVEGCPAGATAQPGTFSGTFRFRGEDGFTAAHAHRIHGTVGAPTAPTDRRQEKGQLISCFVQEPLWKEKGLEFLGHDISPTLAAESIAPERTILLAAAPFELNGGPSAQGAEPATIVAVLVREELEGLTITANLISGGPTKRVLRIAPDGSQAVLRPGEGFRGSATYLANPPQGSGDWSGDLSVPLPGVGTVALAGPGFTARLGG